MGQLSDKDKIDLNDNKIGIVDKMEMELLSEKLEMNGESATDNGRSHIMYRYSSEELFEIGKRPECRKELKNNVVIKTHKLSKFDKSEIRERTMSLNRNLNSTESSGRKNNLAGAGIYRSNENSDHLILSQHFKSFNMGCQMPSMMHPNMTSAFNRDFSGRGRVGSGRILSRDVPWDYRPDDGGTNNSGFNYRTGGSLMGPPRESKRDYHRDEKFYSRDREGPYPYNYDQRYGRQYSSSYGDRYNNYNNHGYDEEPEWFSGGPKSQNDYIELHGFDDDKNRSTHSLKSGKISYSDNNESSLSDLPSELSKNNSSSQTSSHRSSTPTKKNDSNNNEPILTNRGDEKVSAEVPIKHDFNFEDFLKLDSINGFVSNDQFSKDNQSSRFSKWFRSDTVQKSEDDLADTHNQNTNMMDQSSSKHLSASLLNLLQRNDSVVSSKSSSIQSVEEVEAKILQCKEFVPKSASGSNIQSSNDGLAFKKLLAQIQQNQAAAAAQTVFNPNIVPAVHQNSNYFNAALLNQQPHLNGLNLMKILSEQQMQFNLQQQQFLQSQQSLLFKQQLQQNNSHPSLQQAQQQEIYKKLFILDQIQKQNQLNLSNQNNLMYPSNAQQNNLQSHYRSGSYRKPHTTQSHDQIYINRNQMHQQQQNYLNQPAFTPTSVRRHLAANMDPNKISSCNKQTEQQNNLLNNVNINALSASDRINYEANMTSGKNREEVLIHQPQLNAKPGRPILKGSQQHHVQFAPTNYIQQ